MLQTTINVVEVTPPAMGKKRGRVKDATGMLYQVGFPLLSSFQPGGTYQITYKEDSFNGNQFRVVEGAQPASGISQPAAMPSLRGPATPTHTGTAAATSGAYTKSFGGQDLSTAERIFVCGALNAALGNPNVSPSQLSPSSITQMVNCYREAWKRTFGGQPSAADEMNDEIPFNSANSSSASGGSGGFR